MGAAFARPFAAPIWRRGIGGMLMKQPLQPGNSTTYDQMEIVIQRTRRGEPLGVFMRDEDGVLVYEVTRGQRAYGIVREGDRVLSVGGKPARNAVRAAKLMNVHNT